MQGSRSRFKKWRADVVRHGVREPAALTFPGQRRFEFMPSTVLGKERACRRSPLLGGIPVQFRRQMIYTSSHV